MSEFGRSGRGRAWTDIHARLPPHWLVGPLSEDPLRRRWEVVARSPKPVGRGSVPEYIVGSGESELAALTDLAASLWDSYRERRVAEIVERARLAFVQSAERESKRALGRPLSGDELMAVVELSRESEVE